MRRTERRWLGSAQLAIIAGLLSASGRANGADAATGWVVWASNRDSGRHEIYRMRADGSAATRLTFAGGKFPIWAPDGRWIAFHHTADDSTHVMRWDGSDAHELCPGIPVFWLHDNGGVVCGERKGGYEGSSRADTYYVADPESHDPQSAPRVLFRRSDFAHLTDGHLAAGERHLIPGGMTHDRRYLVGWVFGLFQRGYRADNGEFRSPHSSVLLDLLNPAQLYYLGPGCTSTTPPRGDLVFHVSRQGDTAPDIFRMSTAHIADRSSYERELGHTDTDWGHEYFPRVSTDNQWLTYGASTGCHLWNECDYDVFLHRLGTAENSRVRLTEHPANDNYPHLYVGQPWAASASPRLLLSPDRWTFWRNEPATIRVNNAGGGTLGPIEAQTDVRWLQIERSGDGNRQRLSVKISDSADLGSGWHTGSIAIRSDGAGNSPSVLPVRLYLAEPVSRRDGGVRDGGVRDSGTAGRPTAGGCRIGDFPAPSPPPLSFLLPALGVWGVFATRSTRVRRSANASPLDRSTSCQTSVRATPTVSRVAQ